MISFLINLFHSIPHFNFSFKLVKPTFDLDWQSEYAQSLAVIGAVVGLASFLLLLTIIITWICQCCAREDTSVKPRRKVRRLSTILFILSIFCFFFLGFCLFGNDQINRGVLSSTTSINDINHQLKMALTTSSTLNDISRNASMHVKALEELVLEKSKKAGTNQTLINDIDTLLTTLSDSIDTVLGRLSSLKNVLDDVSFLEKAKLYAERIEFERWMVLVCLPSIMLCVLFAGVISFCRQSKKGAVMFSGLGIAIFILVCILLAIVLPFTVALADFCGQGGDYLTKTISQPLLKSLAFYSECDPRPTHDNLPPHLGVGNMSDELTEMQVVKTKLDSLMDTAFNKSADIQKASSLLLEDGSRSLRTIGALESGLACYAYKEDVKMAKSGICGQAVIGASVLSLCLLLLALFMFSLLLIVSKSWNLFTRLASPRPRMNVLTRGMDIVPPSIESKYATTATKKVSFRGSDYIEVDEDDPFFPRTNDSNIPVDIYGTHVFNPRTRDRTEPSTGTTTATANGGVETDPLWSRGGPVASAPNQTIGRTYDDHYGNYQDRYDV